MHGKVMASTEVTAMYIYLNEWAAIPKDEGMLYRMIIYF